MREGSAPIDGFDEVCAADVAADVAADDKVHPVERAATHRLTESCPSNVAHGSLIPKP